MKDLIIRIAKALVDHPEQVEVLEVEGEQVLVLELKVAKEGCWEDNRQAGPDCSRHTDYIKRCFRQGKKTYCHRDYRLVQYCPYR